MVTTCRADLLRNGSLLRLQGFQIRIHFAIILLKEFGGTCCRANIIRLALTTFLFDELENFAILILAFNNAFYNKKKRFPKICRPKP